MIIESQQEYYSRKLPGTDIHSLCKVPFSGFEISPEGNIVLCCMSPRSVLKHIDDVDDLEEFYNGTIMEKYRQSLEDNKYPHMVPCSVCYKKELGNHMTLKKNLEIYPMGDFKKFDSDWKARKENKKRPLRFLEYTLSNICNATCATCGSFFSHKWQSLDKKFDRHVFPLVKLDENSITKIEKVLYGLETLVIKGGEPFADIRNIRILKKLYEINPSCRVLIISNMYTITPEAMKILKMANPGTLEVTASIDGVGKVYDWIRSNNFEHLIKTMETYYKETGLKININVTVSLYNFFHLEKILDYFKNKEYVRCINISQVTTEPLYTNCQLLPKKIFDTQIEKYKEIFPKALKKMTILSRNFLEEKHRSKFDETQGKKLFFKEMKKMNDHRGFDLCNHIPELKEWRDTP